MSAIVLKTDEGVPVEVVQGESARIVAIFRDYDRGVFVKASILSLVATLVNKIGGATINGRNAVDILDTAGGTLSSTGVLTLKLGPADNPIVSAAVGVIEVHELVLTWTWLDADGDLQTSKQPFEIHVRPTTVPV